MKLPGRKSKFQQVLETVEHSIDNAGTIGRSLTSLSPRSEHKLEVPAGARTAGIVAGTLVAVTAGSAGISSYRRRREGPSDVS